MTFALAGNFAVSGTDGTHLHSTMREYGSRARGCGDENAGIPNLFAFPMSEQMQSESAASRRQFVRCRHEHEKDDGTCFPADTGFREAPKAVLDGGETNSY